jgi:anti-sigma B factor antagonist
MALTIDKKLIVDNNYWSIKLVGEVDVANANKFREALAESYEEQGADIVLDASELSYIDSTGLGIVIGAYGRMKERGHSISIKDARQNVKKLLQITSLDKIFCSQ